MTRDLPLSGREVSRRFYEQIVQRLAADVPHAAALLGEGSEVLGFDDEISSDHDFGPRVQLFVEPGSDAAPVHVSLKRLPADFGGFPVAYPVGERHGGRAHHQVEVTTVRSFFTARLGVDPVDGLDLADWLLTPTQILASLTGGLVFHDPSGLLAARRQALSWYPDDVWRYELAAGWLRVGQQEAFVGRTGARGDELGSRTVAAGMARDLVRIAFLVERRWAPYSKWLTTAFTELSVADEAGVHLKRALGASRWQDREAELCAAAATLATATNHLGLAEMVDPAPRRFHSRDIQVLGVDRLTRVLIDAITDPALRTLVTRLGRRPGRAVGRLPGSIDQATDNVEILTVLGRRRDYAPLLGLR